MRRGLLAPVSRRQPWILGGLAVQVAGMGVPVGYLIATAHRLSIGHITGSTVRLAWRSDSHTTVGLTLLLSGALVFAVGSTLMARPFCRRLSTLLIAVPIAAIIGMFVLGALAILVTAVVSEGWDSLNWVDLPVDGGGGRRKKRSRRSSH